MPRAHACRLGYTLYRTYPIPCAHVPPRSQAHMPWVLAKSDEPMRERSMYQYSPSTSTVMQRYMSPPSMSAGSLAPAPGPGNTIITPLPPVNMSPWRQGQGQDPDFAAPSPLEPPTGGGYSPYRPPSDVYPLYPVEEAPSLVEDAQLDSDRRERRTPRSPWGKAVDNHRR